MRRLQSAASLKQDIHYSLNGELVTGIPDQGIQGSTRQKGHHEVWLSLPVVVEFTVTGKAANPTDVKVVGSSLMARLDKAAIDAVSAMVLSSTCEKKRYRLRMSFKLEN